MIAAIYARQSVSHEAGVERQVELATQFIAQQPDWRLAAAHIYTDNGVSGQRFDRAGLTALLAACEETPVPFDALVVMESSRLGRKMSETLKVQERLIGAGVRVFHYQDGSELLLDTPTQKLVASVNNFSAEDYTFQGGKKARAALHENARKGFATGNKVYGYRTAPVGERAKHGKVVPDHFERRVYEPEAVIVRQIFTAYAAGRGLRGLGKDLTDAGVPGPRATSQGWSPQTLRDLLANPIYTGVMVYGKTAWRPKGKKGRRKPLPESQWIRVPDPALRIIDDALWEAAQQRRADLKGVYLRGTNGQLQSKPLNAVEAKHLLTGLLECSLCHGPMGIGARTKDGQRSVFLRCRKNNDKGPRACPNGRTIPVPLAERALLTAVEQHLATRSVLKAVEENLGQDTLYAYLYGIGQPPAPDALAAQRTLVTTQLAETEARIAKLITAVTAGGPLPSLVAALKDEERTKADLTRTLAALDQAVRAPRWNPEEWGKKVEAAAQGWQTLVSLKPELIRAKLAKLLGGTRLTVSPPDAAGRVTFSGTLSLAPILADLQLPRFRTPPAAVTKRSTGPTAGPTSPRRCASPSSRRPSS